MGVSPLWIVAGVLFTGMKFPSFFSSAKNSIPGVMSSREPPLARAADQTAEKAAFARRGSPLRATLPLYSGFLRSAQRCGTVLTTFRLIPNAMTPK